jgi:exodeoxyribonuclease VII large subunit
VDLGRFLPNSGFWAADYGTGPTLAVRDLTLHLATLVRYDDILHDVWVRGEVSSLNRSAAGHLYFTLKDEEACLQCVVWRSSVVRIRFDPKVGLQVLAHGHLEVYPARGHYQLVVDELQPDGAGAQHASLEQVKARLLAEGLLDAERKRPLPRFPRRVAVVTSLHGAAVQDICATLRRDPHPPEIILVPAQVQGEEAEALLCRALRLAWAESGADLLILARGGGAAEDLWAFNGERLARTIVESPVPVISAVGHETDVTLADLVADVRVPTPTAAAELVLAQRADMVQRARRATLAATTLFRMRLEASRQRFQGLQGRLPLSRPEALSAGHRQRLALLDSRLQRAMSGAVTAWQHRLALAGTRLHAVSPLATLGRGYALVQAEPDGRLITDASTVCPGDLLTVRLARGSIGARVSDVRPEAEEQG